MATETSPCPRGPLVPPPPLATLRLPLEPTPYALGGMAHAIWRLFTQSRQTTEATDAALESGNPAEEHKSVCEFMRLYATLRFYQLALLLGTTGSIVTALSSQAVRTSFARAEFLKTGGLIVSMAFVVMEFRASSNWHRLRARANALAQVLRYEPFPVHSRWNPLSTTGVGFYLHLTMATLWFSSLFFRL
jgi:hypothetical protein